MVILAALCALWLKQRLFGALTVFDVCIPVIFLSPLQYETLFITANVAHGPLPVLLIVLYCLVWTVTNLPLRYSLVPLINFVAIYTGFGFFLGVITPIALLADFWLHFRHRKNGVIYFAVSFVASILSMASFFIHYTFQTSVDCAPNLFSAPWSFTQFLLLIFANLFGVKGASAFPLLVGAVILSALLAALCVAIKTIFNRTAAERSVAWSVAILMAYSLVFAANAAYGRSCLGPQVAQVSRYVIYMELGLLGMYFALLLLPKSPSRFAALLVFAAALLGTVPIRQQDEKVMQFVSGAKQKWRACYVSAEDIRECNRAVGYGVYPTVTLELKAKLDFLKRTKQKLYADLP